MYPISLSPQDFETLKTQLNVNNYKIKDHTIKERTWHFVGRCLKDIVIAIFTLGFGLEKDCFQKRVYKKGGQSLPVSPIKPATMPTAYPSTARVPTLTGTPSTDRVSTLAAPPSKKTSSTLESRKNNEMRQKIEAEQAQFKQKHSEDIKEYESNILALEKQLTPAHLATIREQATQKLKATNLPEGVISELAELDVKTFIHDTHLQIEHCKSTMQAIKALAGL